MKPILIAAALCAATPPIAAVAMDTTEAGLDGQWRSLACEVRPQPAQDGGVGEWWLTREITFDANRIAAEFTTYAGPGCEVPLQVLSFAGSVEVLGASPVLDGAVDANLTIDDYVRFTPLVQGFADFLNSMPVGACGAEAWQVGTTQDVLQTGCAMLGLEPGTVTVEYEVLAAQGDMLYFGARPVDGSFLTSPDQRPKALLVPLLRAD